MHPSIIAVWKKKSPNRKEGIKDVMFWHRDVGLLIDSNRSDAEKLHGLVAWAEVERHKKRFKMHLDLSIAVFVFPEIFFQNKKRRVAENRSRNPWRILKAKMSIHCSPDRSNDENYPHQLLRPAV